MPAPKVHLPLETRCSTYFVDEAGAKGSQGEYFVTAAVKTDDPDRVLRGFEAVRQESNYTNADELKFGRVNKGSLPVLRRVIDDAVGAGARFGIFVLDKRHFDPWVDVEQWEGHLFATERLLRGMTTRRELGVALLDHISVPKEVSYGAELLARINGRMGNRRFLTAVSLDSKTCPGLQIADIVASSAYHYRRGVEEMGQTQYLQQQSPKAQLARHVAETIGLGDFSDHKSDIASARTSHPQSLTELRDGVASLVSEEP